MTKFNLYSTIGKFLGIWLVANLMGCEKPDVEKKERRIGGYEAPRTEKETYKSSQQNIAREIKIERAEKQEKTLSEETEKFFEEIEEKAPSNLEEKTKEVPKDKWIVGSGPVVRIKIKEKGTEWPIDARVKFLNKEGKEIMYYKGDAEIGRTPYKGNAKDGVISFNILPGDSTAISKIEVISQVHYAIRGNFPLYSFLGYSKSGLDSLPAELKYIQKDVGRFRLKYNSDEEFHEKMRNRNYIYDQVEGSFVLIPIEIEMKKIPFDVNME